MAYFIITNAPSLATFLIRHADPRNVEFKSGVAEDNIEHRLKIRANDVGRLGGGTDQVVELWFVEGLLYFMLLSVIVSAVLGYSSMHAVNFSLRRLASIGTSCIG